MLCMRLLTLQVTLQEQFAIYELINRRTKQLVVHSYLYYRLNESRIQDGTFDAWCKELVTLGRQYPDIAEQTKYWYLGKQFDESGSGYFLVDYPSELRMDAEIFLHGFDGKK